jgi:hypothetical protein
MLCSAGRLALERVSQPRAWVLLWQLAEDSLLMAMLAALAIELVWVLLLRMALA